MAALLIRQLETHQKLQNRIQSRLRSRCTCIEEGQASLCHLRSYGTIITDEFNTIEYADAEAIDALRGPVEGWDDDDNPIILHDSSCSGAITDYWSFIELQSVGGKRGEPGSHEDLHHYVVVRRAEDAATCWIQICVHFSPAVDGRPLYVWSVRDVTASARCMEMCRITTKEEYTLSLEEDGFPHSPLLTQAPLDGDESGHTDLSSRQMRDQLAEILEYVVGSEHFAVLHLTGFGAVDAVFPRRLLGWHAADLLDRSFIGLLSPEDRVFFCKVLRRCHHDGLPQRLILKVACAAGFLCPADTAAEKQSGERAYVDCDVTVLMPDSVQQPVLVVRATDPPPPSGHQILSERHLVLREQLADCVWGLDNASFCAAASPATAPACPVLLPEDTQLTNAAAAHAQQQKKQQQQQQQQREEDGVQCPGLCDNQISPRMGGMPCSHLPLTPDSLFSGDEEAAIASPPSPRYSRSESKAGDVDMPLQKQQRRLATPPPAPPPLPPESGAAAAAAAAVEEDACLQPSSALLPKRHSGEAMAAQRPIVSSGSLDAAALPLTISTSYLAVGGGLLGLSRALGTPSAADAIEAAGEQTHYHRHQQQICVAIVSESNQESEWGDSAVCNPMPMCAQHVEASGLAENPGDEHTPIYVSSENEQGSRRVVGGGGAIEGVSLLQGHAGGSAKIEIGLSDIFAAYPTKSKASSLNVHNARVFDNVLDTLNIGAIRPIPH